jgi:colicin import membrane protein
VATDAEEVRLALVEVRAAALADMVVDSAGKVSWWLTQLGADVEVSEVGEAPAWCSCSWCITAKSKEVARTARRAAARVEATDAEAAAQVKATAEAEAATRPAAEVDAMAEAREEYAEIGIMVEEAVSAEACRLAARLAVAEVWRGGVDAAADEDTVWAVVLAGRPSLQAARLSVREAAEAVGLVTAEEAAFLEAAARMRIPPKEKAAMELKAALVSAEAWVAHVRAHTDAKAEAAAGQG